MKTQANTHRADHRIVAEARVYGVPSLAAAALLC